MFQMIFTLLLLCAAGALGAIVQRPKNLAISVGGSSYFNCSTNSSSSITWVFSLDGIIGSSSAKEITSGNCDIVADFSGNFVTEKPNLNVCNLIVFNANLQLAGYYSCATGFSASATSQGILVVADTRSNIVTNATDFIDGCEETFFYETVVKYSGPLPISPSTLPPLYPFFNWTLKSEPNNVIQALENVTTTTSSAKIIVNATIPSVPSYVCTLYFKPPTTPLPPSCDNSTPSFTFSWETPENNTSCIDVTESNITVTPYIIPGICEAKILECRPYAYPPPHDIHWLDVIRNEVVNGTRITAEFGGEYVCSVTNAINGRDHSANVTYILNDDSAFTMDKCEGVLVVTASIATNNQSDIYTPQDPNKISLQSNADTYNCGDATGNIAETLLTCKANGLPNPTYAWYDQCQNQISTAQQTTVTTSGSYKCVANNSINDRNFIGSSAKEVAPPGSSTDDGMEWLLLLILLLLVFLLPACVFLPYYGLSKSCRENVNDEFPWIEKALPCMNGKGCECSGEMVLFIFCLVICGIVFVPWILIASHCCQKNSKKSQGDISLRERNGSTGSHRQSGAPSQPPPERPAPGDPYHNSHAHTSYHHSTSNRSMHSPSPVSASGVEYGELRIDAKPGSRKPIELIIQKESAYAELQKS